MATPPGGTPTDWVERTQRPLERFYWLSLSEGPGARRREWSDAVAVGSDLPTAAANSLFVHAGGIGLRATLREAQEFFRSTPAWRITCPEALRGEVAPLAAAAGLRRGDAVPRMVLAPLPPAPPAPADLVIRPVESARDLEEFIEVEVRAFDIPRRIARAAFARHRWLRATGEGSIQWLVGNHRDRPASIAAQMTWGGITAVFFVGTVPELRGRGFGRAMTWAAVDRGRQQGADSAWLHATPMGRPLYEAMGFRRQCDDLEWTHPAVGLGRLRTWLWNLGVALRSPGPTGGSG